jgi:predicted Fe-Mo cluster-binding NifX family protein
MKVIITVSEGGLDSLLEPFTTPEKTFLLVDTETGESRVLVPEADAGDRVDEICLCQMVAGHCPQALITKRINPVVRVLLKRAGVEVVVDPSKIAREALENYLNRLSEPMEAI